jgi:xanthine dehydrogenase iron-sulfur cluster and FAD-binding subunit A
MRLCLDELQERRRQLVAYSDAQRAEISQGVADLKHPLALDGLSNVFKNHPMATLLGGGGVLLGGLLARKFSRFSAAPAFSLGTWAGRQLWKFVRNKTAR